MKVEVYNNMGITFDTDKKMVNATAMSKAFPKKNLSRIMKSKEMLEYKDALLDTLSTEIPISSSADIQLVSTSKGGNNLADEQITWIHPKLAIRLAQKLDAKFAVWVDGKIEELFTKGYTGINDEVTARLDALAEQNDLLRHAIQEVQKTNLMLQEEQTRMADNSRALTYEVSLQSELSYLMNLAGAKHDVEYPVRMGRLDMVLKRKKPYITVFELKNYNHELSGYDIDIHLFSQPTVEPNNKNKRYRGYLNKLIEKGFKDIKFHFIVHKEPSVYAVRALEKANAFIKNNDYNDYNNIEIKISRLSEVVAYYWGMVQKEHGTRCNDHLNSMPKLKGIIECLPIKDS